jgi:RNA polymerase sigma factor for flagellar operon FliA
MTSSTAYKTEHTEGLTSAGREKLILEHLSLVHWIASRIHDNLPDSISLEDLVSTGILGLIEAVDHFDPRYNVKLSTYAQHRIRGAILDSIRGLDGVSGPKRQRLKQVESAVSGLEQRLKRVPTEEEIAAELKLPLEEYQQWLVELRGVKIGTIESNGDGRFMALVDSLSDNAEHQPGWILEKAELERILAEGVSKMPARERLILSLYYHDGLTLREISSVMDLHLTRIAQLKAQAIMRLRAYLARYWPSRCEVRR